MKPTAGDSRPRQDRRLEAEHDIMDSDVLIIGAGPTGLVLALWLTMLGVKVRIIDKAREPGTTSRATRSISPSRILMSRAPTPAAHQGLERTTKPSAQSARRIDMR
jgi:2-polyprenyl-6-methoxyphenol hydroxylase-like FAD-dependent oxidoreductase